ncbi:MAG: hypothetical protein HY907_05455 [Deltaproteobacteria bacterium]|nr:hypothetical protein [Deltaproteobacteria bacterium]
MTRRTSPRPPRLAAALAAALGVALLPASAAATDLRLGADLAWVRDSSFDAFWENDLLGRLDLCLSYTPLALGPFRLDVEVGYGYAGYLSAVSNFDQVRSSLSIHDVYAGLRASFAPEEASWVRPYARVQGGLAIGLGSFADEGPRADPLAEPLRSSEADDLGGLVYGGGGVEFALPLGALMDEPPELLSEPMAFGVFVEGGYFYRTPLDFSPSVSSSDDPDRIPVQGFSAGDLDLSGGELRVGFVARL